VSGNGVPEYAYGSASNPSGEQGEQLSRRVREELKRHAGVRSVCELGCGNGVLSGALAADGYRVVGSDASPSGIAVASTAYPDVKFVRGEIGAQTVRELGGGFDAVVAVEVIEHLYRPADLFEAATSLLVEGGKLVVTTPYHGYWKNLAIALAGGHDVHYNPLWDGGHVKFFSVKTLRKLLEESGFDVLRFSFVGRVRPFARSMVCTAEKRRRSRA